MPCALEVELQPEGPVEVGAEVTVQVRATADEPLECSSVRCEAGWQTHGRGEKDSDRPFAQAGRGGALRPDAPLKWEFKFQIPPEGPVTYQGLRFSPASVLRIEWHVRVCLDGTWAKDPEATLPLVVVPCSV
jgi:hypothetical protein